MDVAFDEEDAPSIPEYLANPKVSEGILGLLGLQRCDEEQARLINEMESLVAWIASQISSIQFAQSICQGNVSYLQDRQGHVSLLTL